MSAAIPQTTVTRAQRRPGTFAARRRREAWLMVSPSILIILLLSIFPLIYSLTLSFQRRDLQHPGDNQFVGLDNYATGLTDSRVWSSLQNTFFLVIGGMALEFLLGLGLALLIVGELRAKRFIIPILMLPVMMVPVIVALTWRLLWDNQYGAINQMLGWIAGHDVNIVWLNQKSTAMFAMLVTQVWQWTPFMFLVLLAGLTGVNPELYEAAALDGASWGQAFRSITLPGLAPVIAVALLFRGLDAFKVFDLIYMMTKGQPGTSTETISYYIYYLGREIFNMGYAAAISYLLLILLTVLATLYVGRFLREEAL